MTIAEQLAYDTGADPSRSELGTAPTASPFAAGPVLGIAAATAGVLVAVSSLYGYHRDELYYLWGGEHLALGYVDHPPLVPLLARAADVASGHTLIGLRALAAAIVGWLVVAGALVARELGGRRRAQILAAFAVACVPATRAPEILYGTTAADAAIWAALLVLVTRLLRTGDRRLWLGIGVVTGIGLETKWSVVVLVVAVVVGLLVTPQRRLLVSGWLVAGGLVTLALWAPNLWWNATHDWAFLEFQRNLSDKNGGLDKRILFFPLVLLLTGVAPVVVWLPGWRDLGRRPPFRAIAVAGTVIVGVVFLAGGKPYYVAPIFIALLAAGAVWLERSAPQKHRRTMWVLAMTAVVTVPLTIPALPPTALDAIKPINPEMGEMIGWPELAQAARSAYETLPAAERAHAIILTSNYGSASAILRDAPDLPVYSAHNSYWLAGPPPDSATTMITVGYREASVRDLCGSMQRVGTVTNPFGVQNDELGRPILLCRDVSAPWPQLWTTLKHYQ